MASNGRLFQILATTILQAVEFSRLATGFVANHPRIEGGCKRRGVENTAQNPSGADVAPQ
jgi:hypothetical protein